MCLPLQEQNTFANVWQEYKNFVQTFGQSEDQIISELQNHQPTMIQCSSGVIPQQTLSNFFSKTNGFCK